MLKLKTYARKAGRQSGQFSFQDRSDQNREGEGSPQSAMLIP
jgi:hypothetical protein